MPSHLQHRVILLSELAVRGSCKGTLVRPVQLVAHHRGAQRREMNADLVLPPRLETAVNERVRATIRPRSDLLHVDDRRGI